MPLLSDKSAPSKGHRSMNAQRLWLLVFTVSLYCKCFHPTLMWSSAVIIKPQTFKKKKNAWVPTLIHRTRNIPTSVQTWREKKQISLLQTQRTLVPGICSLRSLLNNSRYWVMVSIQSVGAKSPSGLAANTDGSSGMLGPRKDCINSFMRFQQSPGTTQGQYSTWGSKPGVNASRRESRRTWLVFITAYIHIHAPLLISLWHWSSSSRYQLLSRSRSSDISNHETPPCVPWHSESDFSASPWGHQNLHPLLGRVHLQTEPGSSGGFRSCASHTGAWRADLQWTDNT